ncbi:hypothetical protein Q8W13_23245 [Photobacterium damselae subsp. piscicida]|nr:hypothetical protein [Photobacterium damselae subsp. piscicida]
MVTLTPRQRLYQIIFGTQTRYGQLFDIGLIGVTTLEIPISYYVP